MSASPIDYTAYATLDDVAHDHAVGDELYDDFAAWKEARGLPDRLTWDKEEPLQREFLQQYDPKRSDR